MLNSILKQNQRQAWPPTPRPGPYRHKLKEQSEEIPLGIHVQWFSERKELEREWQPQYLPQYFRYRHGVSDSPSRRAEDHGNPDKC